MGHPRTAVWTDEENGGRERRSSATRTVVPTLSLKGGAIRVGHKRCSLIGQLGSGADVDVECTVTARPVRDEVHLGSVLREERSIFDGRRVQRSHVDGLRPLIECACPSGTPDVVLLRARAVGLKAEFEAVPPNGPIPFDIGSVQFRNRYESTDRSILAVGEGIEVGVTRQSGAHEAEYRTCGFFFEE